MCSAGPRTSHGENGFARSGSALGEKVLDLQDIQPKSARTRKLSTVESCGMSSNNSALLSPRHSVASASSSRVAKSGRDLWLTPNRFQVGRLGAVKEMLRQENLDHCEKRTEARRRKLEAEKAARQRKYDELLERRERAKERAQTHRSQEVEARQLQSCKHEKARETSRDRLKLEAQKQAMKAAMRLEIVECRHEAQREQHMRTQADYERRIRLAKDALERQRASEQWRNQKEAAEKVERNSIRQEAYQRRERSVKAQLGGYRESNLLRSRKVNTVRQERSQAEKLVVELSSHALVRQRLEKQEEEQRTTQTREAQVKDQRDKDRQVLRAKREHAEQVHHLVRQREHAVAGDRRARSLEQQEWERERKKIQHDQEVEKRRVQSARLRDRSWEENKWIPRGSDSSRLARSDGDISLKTASRLSSYQHLHQKGAIEAG